MPLRVLHSFPHKLGAERLSYAAWQQARSLVDAGANLLAFPGVLQRALPAGVEVRPTLARGRFRIPYRLLGTLGACKLHDWIVSRRIPALVGSIDVVHVYPLAALKTIEVAKRHGILTVLERCNAHTAFAYNVVREECQRLGVSMPPGHEHDFNTPVLRREEAEYEKADYLLCPSEFVAKTFLDRGFPPSRIARFQYGCDETRCYPTAASDEGKPGLTVLFAAGCAPRKGLHYALTAWVQSPASRVGTFLVVGEFIPGYAERLGTLLTHPSVKVMGYRKDLPDLMRAADVFVLPSIEEGSALVTYDARASGCVLVVSDASGAICQHMTNALVHRARDVTTLADHLTILHEERALLQQLRQASLETAHELTWSVSGRKLLATYGELLGRR